VSALAALAWMAGAVLALGAAAVSGVVSDEFRARLDRIPYGLLRVAIGRLPQEVRADVGEEWRAELDHILHRAEAFPLTRLLLGTRFALGLLRAAPSVGKNLAGVRPAAEEAEPPRKRVMKRGAGLITAITRPDLGSWRIWRNRLAITLTTAGVMTILLNWQIGAGSAVLFALAHTIMKSRIPAAPRSVGGQTSRLMSALRQDQYTCMHGLTLPGTGESIAHLIIGPSGIRILIPHQWNRRLPVRADAAGHLYYGPGSQDAVLDAARHKAVTTAKLIGAELGTAIQVRPGLLILGPRLFRNAIPAVDAIQLRGVDVFGPRAARTWLKRTESTITAAERERLREAAIRVFTQPAPATPSDARPAATP
jgi:hypothetical protein